MNKTRQEHWQDTVVAHGTAHKGKLVAQNAVEFAEDQGQNLKNYDPRADTWQLTDGKVYTSSHIIYAQAARKLL